MSLPRREKGLRSFDATRDDVSLRDRFASSPPASLVAEHDTDRRNDGTAAQRLTKRSHDHDLEAALTVSHSTEDVPQDGQSSGLQNVIDELDEHQLRDFHRWRGREHDILPHTGMWSSMPLPTSAELANAAAGGDAYNIGDIYDGLHCAKKWRLDEYAFQQVISDNL